MSPRNRPQCFLQSSPPCPLTRLYHYPSNSNARSKVLNTQCAGSNRCNRYVYQRILSHNNYGNSNSRRGLSECTTKRLLNEDYHSLVTFNVTTLRRRPPYDCFPRTKNKERCNASSREQKRSILLLLLNICMSVCPKKRTITQDSNSQIRPYFKSPFPKCPLLQTFLRHLLIWSIYLTSRTKDGGRFKVFDQ